ncbi:GCN5-related N-acetyltransferase [Tsukamurella paurometabola DSM 20162]|uniref:GCN5-related N-acetyltransferase n=1 Tax=Tsukamurella paurometabola (strain ATCC 8368 / DSM 20162 / CCUG 35730 / CIP 100753 / JCM 10117 / KCTC 9821 / NBRC 16120 / NCIMB 702349 / NCTC 13040) TaxID=521096 RepID=D5UR94_TSUPD|nr:GCN5-related N-acetyltransferase [Tsukamurella paurometabola DSM 20162]
MRPRLPVNGGGAGVELTVGGVPVAERDFFIEEFHGVTIVVALPALNALAVQVVARTVDEFVAGDTRFVFVVATEWVRDTIAAVGGREMSSPTAWSDEATAELWLSVAESSCVVVGVDRSAVARTAGVISAGVRASKMVLTDPGGGWDDPPRSFADIDVHHDRISAHLAARGLDDYIPAARQALAGGAYSVNLCRAEDLEFELLTFEGRGTVLTQGRYLHIEPLRVDDFPAIEALVAQGVGDGTLKPRHRIEVAKMAASGIGARVLRTGHLAGIVGLETDRYAGTGFGEVSGLITVAEFSGLGAGGLLMDGLLDICREKGLANLFAVTVSAQAADFFAKRGFREVSREDVPAAKWEGYEADRFDLARCFVRSARPVTSTE